MKTKEELRQPLVNTITRSKLQLQATELQLEFINRHMAVFESLDNPHIDGDVDTLRVYGCSRDETMRLIQYFPGQWTKELGYNQQSVNYNTTYEGIALSLRCVPPPPSCKLIEVEELRPAQVIKTHRLVCSDETITSIPQPL